MRLKVMERDFNLLRYLESYALLSTTQVCQLAFPGVNYRTVLRRLRRLEGKKIIARSRECRGGRSVWFITEKGASFIDKIAVIKSVNRNTLTHDLIVNDVRIKLASLNIASGWLSAHKMKQIQSSPGTPVPLQPLAIPDWTCVLQAKSGAKGFALEVELSDKGIKRMQEVFFAHLIRRGEYDHVWYFVPNKKFGERLAGILKKLRTSNRPSDSWFLWSVISDFLKEPKQATIFIGTSTVATHEVFKIGAHGSAHAVSRVENEAA